MSSSAGISADRAEITGQAEESAQQLRDIVFSELQTVEEAEQPVAGLIAARLGLLRCHLGESLLLHGESRLKVHLSRFDAFVSEP